MPYIPEITIGSTTYKVKDKRVDTLTDTFIRKCVSEMVEVSTGTLNEGKYITQETGVAYTAANWSYSGFIEISEHSNILLLTCPTVATPAVVQSVACVAFYSSTDVANVLSTAPIEEGPTGDYEWKIVNIPLAAKYMRVSVYTSSASEYRIYGSAAMDANELQAELEKLTTIDRLPNIIELHRPQYYTRNGLTLTKTGANTYHLSGEMNQQATTTFFMYQNRTVMPEGFERGKTYAVYMKSRHAGFWIYRYSGNDDSTGTALWRAQWDQDGEQYAVFTIPSNGVEGMYLAFKCSERTTEYDEDITIYVTEIKTGIEQAYISKVYGITRESSTKKMLSIGNSFLAGSVYQGGDHLYECEFHDAIYGQVADSLCVAPENVDHYMFSGTGFIFESSATHLPPFSETICETDLASYDYLLTHFNGGDLNQTLGTVDATANDGTVAGAVVAVAEHVRESNGRCKLILLSCPPYNAGIAGPNVFVTPLAGGNTIDDMDNLMYQLALKYHFIYVSWQDLEISYHYMDYCDYHEGDTGNVHANSPATYRALGSYAALQIAAVSSPIAIGKQMAIITAQ